MTRVTIDPLGPLPRHLLNANVRAMEPPAVPPPPDRRMAVADRAPSTTAGPGDPTVGAGIADTRSVVRSYAPIVAAEFVGTAVLIMLGPGAAILVARARHRSAWPWRSASPC